MPEINKDQLAEHIRKSDLTAKEKRYLEKLSERTRWIPCRERLPENGQAVIGCDRSGFVARFRFDGDAPPCWVDDHEEFSPLNRIVA